MRQKLRVLVQPSPPQALRTNVVKVALAAVVAAVGIGLAHVRATGHTHVVELLQGHAVVVLVGLGVRWVVGLAARVVLQEHPRVRVSRAIRGVHICYPPTRASIPTDKRHSMKQWSYSPVLHL